MKGKTKTQKGITLVALIITIVVLLILAVVAITAIQNEGILAHANNSATKYNQMQEEENGLLNGFEGLLNNYAGNVSGGTGTIEKISTEISYVGYYANLDEDEEPEGVIYIDKAKSENGSWGGISYTIENVTTGLKDYYVSKKDYEGSFGTKDVLTIVPNTTGEERFYVMALEDVQKDGNTEFSWYYWAQPENNEGPGLNELLAAKATATGIGAGETNTANMIKEWGSYGAKYNRDIWGVIQDGWYVPSEYEWAAFVAAFTQNGAVGGESYYEGLGLKYAYWTSSLGSGSEAFRVSFLHEDTNMDAVMLTMSLRLGTNF